MDDRNEELAIAGLRKQPVNQPQLAISGDAHENRARRAARLGVTEVNTTGWPRPIFLGDYMNRVLLLHTTITHCKLMKCWHAGTLTIGQLLIEGTRIWGDEAETARAVADLEGIKAGLPYGAGGELQTW
ncbi:hypothetical protein AB0L13_46205 [Saccharopolyspora shandongensis]|uniref:hypothetical protein n=1 Tax=Saccharopolyspora shandongensis TaxID=418495 RepID=UPI00343FB122